MVDIGALINARVFAPREENLQDLDVDLDMVLSSTNLVKNLQRYCYAQLIDSTAFQQMLINGRLKVLFHHSHGTLKPLELVRKSLLTFGDTT